MYCPKCQKELPAESTFCPYCGNEKLTETSAPTEQPAEGVTTEETSAAPATQDAPATSGKRVAIAVLCTLVVLAAIAAAFAVGYKMSRDPQLPDATVSTTDSTDAPVTTDAPSADENLFPDDYTLTYENGFNYSKADMSQYITLGKYKDLTATVTAKAEVTKEDVDAYISQLLVQYATQKDVTDRPAKTGDTVVIDFAGTIDGVAFDGGTANDQTLTIGAGGYIDGFEDGVIGMNIGETKTIDVTFPEGYHNADLAGKPAQFAITLDSIKEDVAPEYTDAFVLENFEYETIAAFESDVMAMLIEEREYEILTEKQNSALSIVLDNATVKGYPEGLVEDYMKPQIDNVKMYTTMYSMSYSELVEQVLGMSAADYEAEVRAAAEESIKMEMAIFAIAEAEQITATDADVAQATANFLEYYGGETVEELCTTLGVEQDYFKNMIDFSVIYTKVLEFLVENTTFTGAN